MRDTEACLHAVTGMSAEFVRVITGTNACFSVGFTSEGNLVCGTDKGPEKRSTADGISSLESGHLVATMYGKMIRCFTVNRKLVKVQLLEFPSTAELSSTPAMIAEWDAPWEKILFLCQMNIWCL